jgi:hypothetical protein
MIIVTSSARNPTTPPTFRRRPWGSAKNRYQPIPSYSIAAIAATNGQPLPAQDGKLLQRTARQAFCRTQGMSGKLSVTASLSRVRATFRAARVTILFWNAAFTIIQIDAKSWNAWDFRP